ncbi:PLDc N-terminal domain-containing protein [Lacisediminihabitans profunda]|uniref:Cardiolipin synthase N-terminal domain-containing protein n=1 Tax=Lacisediminihabitans profunda TaxID=2594790 RepID=A0A5C8UQY5_9MICO|nr:PLDc N-terminal domain-containing protein [Lacisediminihabitans profunda]TXN29879.1 hypothetical protein FVP33_12125 [Lacisediminihabitans profunda]
MYLILPLVVLGIVIAALVDIIGSDQGRIRHLDKTLWLLIVILLPLVGSIVWFAIGRERPQVVDRGSFGDPRRRETPVPLPSSSSTEREIEALEREIRDSENEDRIRRLEAELRARDLEN